MSAINVSKGTPSNGESKKQINEPSKGSNSNESIQLCSGSSSMGQPRKVIEPSNGNKSKTSKTLEVAYFSIELSEDGSSNFILCKDE